MVGGRPSAGFTILQGLGVAIVGILLGLAFFLGVAQVMRCTTVVQEKISK